MSVTSSESGHELGASEVDVPNPRLSEEGRTAVGAAALQGRITAEGLVVPYLDTNAGRDRLAAFDSVLAGLSTYFGPVTNDVEDVSDLGEAAERHTDI